VTHNVQGIKPINADEKLQSGIANMISLQAGIACLRETNVEWQNFSFQQGYKNTFSKLYSVSRHIFSSSSEIASTYHTCGGTYIFATERWTHHVHRYIKDATGAGRWSFLTILGKDHNMIVISCYHVCPLPPPSNLCSAYCQHIRIMEYEDESIGIPIDPHHQTI
jgi:hypothetical protein